mmetsp:Transcript_44803/g.130489  ORF Transcript_44803/g.130489 Transcript_44803/m.130489 type:complete len:236 (-) Transcript_44803:417-1124(-)
MPNMWLHRLTMRRQGTALMAGVGRARIGRITKGSMLHGPVAVGRGATQVPGPSWLLLGLTRGGVQQAARQHEDRHAHDEKRRVHGDDDAHEVVRVAFDKEAPSVENEDACDQAECHAQRQRGPQGRAEAEVGCDGDVRARAHDPAQGVCDEQTVPRVDPLAGEHRGQASANAHGDGQDPDHLELEEHPEGDGAQPPEQADEERRHHQQQVIHRVPILQEVQPQDDEEGQSAQGVE